jgi:DNA polymerase-1
MVRAHEVVRDTPVRQILTVHDELLFEGPPDAVEAVRDDIVAAMVGVWDHEPPLVVDVGVGRTWLDAK